MECGTQQITIKVSNNMCIVSKIIRTIEGKCIIQGLTKEGYWITKKEDCEYPDECILPIVCCEDKIVDVNLIKKELQKIIELF